MSTESAMSRPCARCGAMIDPALAALTADGPVCKACESQEALRDQRSLASSSSSFGPLTWGIVSLFCNFFFIPSILAITGGIGELKAVKAARSLGVSDFSDSDRQTKAIFAIVLGAVHPLALVGILGLVFVGGVIGALTAPSVDDYAYDDPYYPSQPYDPYAYGSGDPTYGSDPTHGSVGTNDPSALAPTDANRRTVELDGSRPFGEQLASHLATARALGLRPYLYAHASWCPPCNAVARYANDPLMAQAYEGTYVIGADIDVVRDDDLRAAGFEVIGVPTWFGVDGDGRFDGRTISSSVWGEDIPANMAPPLARFFHAPR